MNIVTWATAPWSPSSYSVLVARTLPNWVRDKHKVTLGTFYGLQGAPLPWHITPKDGRPGGSVLVLPSATGTSYDIDTIIPSYKHFRADVLITICDVWVFKPEVTRATVFCPWFPVDMEPAPQPVLDALSAAVYPMSFSKWGVDVLAKDGV